MDYHIRPGAYQVLDVRDRGQAELAVVTRRQPESGGLGDTQRALRFGLDRKSVV